MISEEKIVGTNNVINFWHENFPILFLEITFEELKLYHNWKYRIG